MERGSITKWLLLAVAIFFLFTTGRQWLFGTKESEGQPLGVSDAIAPAAELRSPEQICAIAGDGFKAELSSKGASLRHFVLDDPRWSKDGRPRDLISNTLESRMPLRSNLHAPDAAEQQVAFNDFDWKLAASDGKSCTFTYEDATTSLKKTISTTGKPFELSVGLEVKNLAESPRTHRLSLEQASWVKKKDTEGGFLSGHSEQLTETVATTNEKTVRFAPTDFEPGDFKDKDFTSEKWRRAPGDPEMVDVSSSYFAQISIPREAPRAPAAELQIEEVWRDKLYPDKEKDPEHGYTYRARLAYPDLSLKHDESAKYEVLTYFGPKDRDLLGALDHGATNVLNLGTFTPIAKTLVWYLHKLYGIVHSWGWAIVLLTITVRLLLFPLSLAQIKSSVAMRKLKPEMDAINEKYKDDTTQRGLAIQELWRKNKVANPVIGCLPMLLQMPVWFALYTALQTAIELYHVPFGPVIPDLSAPGKYYIIPILLGGSSFIQQKLMPPQGDPQQQKMMLYMMPAVFTFMMLVLPAGLGVYMLTNTWVGICQQLAVERYMKAKAGSSGTIEVKEKTPGDGDKSAPALGKGKARVRG